MFLNQERFYAAFYKSLLKLKEIEEGKMHSTNTVPKNNSYLQFDISTLLEGVKKMIKNSKNEILRKTVFLKIQSLEASKRHCEHWGMIHEAKKLG